MPCMPKALFLDRDGTINVDSAYVYRVEDFVLIEGIVELCQKAQAQGYLLIVVTNQSGIARGYYTEEDYQILTEHMRGLFAQAGVHLDAVYHCPHLEGEDRKPAPGMFLKAQRDFEIDMTQSLSLGDKERDIAAATAAGVGRNFLFTGSYQEVMDLLIA